MDWNWLTKQLRKLRLFLFFKCSFVHSFRRIFKPFAKLSYAQTGEDHIIRELLKGVEKGFYVDVGAYHPVVFSNTIMLYKKGWRGLNIDANQESIDRFNHYRLRDKNIQAVISDEVRKTDFVAFEDAAVSSVEEKNIDKWIGKKKIKKRHQVLTQTLGEIFKKNEVPREFDLLTIDVEGHDYEALTSFDIDTYKPTLIVIEMHNFDFNNLSNNKIYRYLTGNGYRFAGYVIMNGYFYRE